MFGCIMYFKIECYLCVSNEALQSCVFSFLGGLCIYLFSLFVAACSSSIIQLSTLHLLSLSYQKCVFSFLQIKICYLCIILLFSFLS